MSRHTLGLLWTYGRAPAGTGGKRRARMDGSGGGRGMAYEARGYKQGWADGRVGRRASRRPKSSQNRALACCSLLSHTMQLMQQRQLTCRLT